MRKRVADGIIGMILAIAILIGLAYCMPAYAEKKNPTGEIISIMEWHDVEKPWGDIQWQPIETTENNAKMRQIYINEPVPTYPAQDVPMESMTDEMKEVLIRSVITEKEERKLAQMLYGEERQYDYRERAAVIWHTFNRVDSPLEANSVDKDITHSHYSGYSSKNPVEDWALWVVRDVAWRYACEKQGYEDVGRVLPREYLYMAMHKGHNRFRTKYKGKCRYWDWSIPSPYEEDKPWENG